MSRRSPQHLDLKDAIHVGHSTGGGEVARYVAQYGGNGRVAKAVLIGAVPPIMVKSDKNPGGLPIEVFDGFRAALAANRAQFFRDIPAGPFYGFNRPGAKVSQGIIDNWWRQGMMGGAKAHYDCIKAFSETDFTEDLKKIDVPVLVMHGDDDQIVPIAGFGAAVVQAAQERHTEGLQGLPARHGHHACRRHQSRSARLLQGITILRKLERPPGGGRNVLSRLTQFLVGPQNGRAACHQNAGIDAGQHQNRSRCQRDRLRPAARRPWLGSRI